MERDVAAEAFLGILIKGGGADFFYRGRGRIYLAAWHVVNHYTYSPGFKRPRRRGGGVYTGYISARYFRQVGLEMNETEKVDIDYLASVINRPGSDT